MDVPTCIMFSLMKREYATKDQRLLKIVHPCCVMYRKIDYKLYTGGYMQEGDGTFHFKEKIGEMRYYEIQIEKKVIPVLKCQIRILISRISASRLNPWPWLRCLHP
jgi:hypothetical protein